MMDPNMSAMGSNSGSSNPFGAPPPPPPSHEIGNPFGASVSATAPATHSTSAPLQDPWTATGTSQASTNSLAAGTQNPFGVPLAPQNSVPMDTNNIISNNINNTMKMNMGETGIGMGNGNGYAAPYGAQTFQQTSPTLQPQAHPSTDSFLTSQHSKQFQQSQYSQPSQYSQQTQSQNPFGAPPTPAPATMNAGVNMTTGLNAHAPGMNATSITNQAPPNNPFGSVIVTPAPPSFATPQSSQFYTNNGSMILSQTQSNPYAMGATKTGTSVATHPNQLVAQQAQPWALPSAAPLPPNSYHPPYTHHPQQQQMVLAPTTTVTSYDPFGTQSCGLVLAHPPEPVNQELDMFFQPGAQNPTPSLQIEQQNDGSIDPPGISANGQPKDPPPRNDIPEDEMDEARSERKALPNMVASPNGTTYPPQIEYGHRPGGKNGNDEDDQQNRGASPRNPYAPALAREAPPGASPLPKAELVRKRGFVLGRISFRTIVMKKWKQTYWVQYGPHTMLWFRSQADFDDWLNNPYHVQTERNFLIKLAVNFVHDLYKPNVRGYQVTQCRSKGYGNKVIRQFKLERWMDYGPTIAAAFGSYNPAEVDALREAVVECMRNTPLNGGIRATGAVRQPNPAERNEDEIYQNHNDMSGRRSSYDDLPSDSEKKAVDPKQPEAESVAEETDLLDVNNWDDVPSEPQIGPAVSPRQDAATLIPGGPPPSQYTAAPPFGTPHMYDQQQQQQQQAFDHVQLPYELPPNQTGYSTAVVPVNGTPQPYPGAPQQIGYTPPPQQQGYAPPQQGYAPPPQQQGYIAPQQQGYIAPQQQALYQAYPPQQEAHQTQQLHHQPLGYPSADPWTAVAPQQQPQSTYLPPPEY